MKRPLENSDDETEAEVQSLSVSNYHLEDEDDLPVSFAVLPIQWGDSESFDANKEQVFLHGSADNGLQKIFMQVTAWKFDLSGLKPEISLLSKDGRWIKLQKPRKSFLETVKTILVTLHFLHRVKKNPQLSSTSLWKNFYKDKELSSYGLRPSKHDLLDHRPLIGEAAKRDAVLAKSKLLLMDTEKKLGNQKLPNEEVNDLGRPGFIVDDIDNDMIDEANEESEAEDDLFNSVCALCDNGGKLLCCDGACTRSFHATEEDGRDSNCASLGFTQKKVDEIQSFYCKNCEYHLHQCFACGELGSSDKAKGAEVIKCASATCDHFYHPHCVAKLLPQVDKLAAMEPERNIADGDPFICPTHYCCVCKESENKMDPELQFAVCRRCPKSYHRKCLPREIAFDGTDDDVIPRAWEGLLPNNRILIYCLNHEIDDELGTPIRDHIKFPNTKATVQEINATNERTKTATKERVVLKKNNAGLDNSSGKSIAKRSEVTGKLSSGKIGSKRSEKMISGSNISRKPKSNETSRSLTENKRSISKKFEKPDCEESQPPTGEKLYALTHKGSEQIKHDNQADDVVNETLSVKPIRSLPPLDADSERRLESVLGKRKFASTHTRSSTNVVEKTIKKGKLEGSVDAVRTAQKKLESGCSIQDVEAVHDADVLKRICKGKASINESQKISLYHGNVVQKSQEGQEYNVSRSGKTSWKRKHIKENDRRGRIISPAKRQVVNKMLEEPNHSQHNPIEGRSSVEGFQPKSAMASPHVEVRDNGCGNLEPISDFGRTHSGNKKGPSVASPFSEYGVTNIEEHHKREEEKCQRESDIRQRVGFCEVQDPDSSQTNCLSGHDPSCGHMGYSYAQVSPLTESSDIMNAPTMERYAPCLDELSHVRMSSLGCEPPTFSRSGTSERRVLQPGCGDVLRGFAPGPHHAYSRHHSAGPCSCRMSDPV